MDTLFFSILLGIVLGAIDIVPMIIKKLPRYSITASFVHFLVATVLIVHVDIPHIIWWLEGGIIGFALMIPMLIHVGHTDKKPLPIIAANAILFGTIAGIVSHYYFL